MRTTEILQKVLPESWGIDAIHRVVATGRRQGWAPDPLFRLEAILPPHRARIDALAARLRLSRAEAERLLSWAAAPEVSPALEERALARALYTAGTAGVIDRLRQALAREVEQGHETAAQALLALEAFASGWQRPLLPVSGKDLVASGVEPGPEVGRRLREIETRWIEGDFSLGRDALLAAPSPADASR
jgi:tRNA nucleotidyltransferase/poly(A) polymerase